MLNKLQQFIQKYDMVQPGDTVICAVSGGADSIALLWGLYLLKDKLQINLEAAHFNHNLRGEESLRDEQFVADFCGGYDIKLHLGRGEVTRGEKGLEASARTARYDYLNQLDGKIATAHTANDNAETVLMHLLRGSGLKGLGGITPVQNKLIRPMLEITRDEVMAFLEEYYLDYVEDSSNETDDFLRNRIRHHVMPQLLQENASFVTAVSAMAQTLRLDEAELSAKAVDAYTTDVHKLRLLPPAVRSRVLATILEQFGVKEPSAVHLAQLEDVVFSDRPSASADFPGKVKIGRVYDRIDRIYETQPFCVSLSQFGSYDLTEQGLRILYQPGVCEKAQFICTPVGKLLIRSRKSGDEITLQGGTKSLKKLFIDRKIPVSERNHIPVIADDAGVIGVLGIGQNIRRNNEDENAVSIWFEIIEN